MALARAALVASMALLVVAPWAVRNTLLHGGFVLIETNGPYNLWRGNGADAFANRGDPRVPHYAWPFESLPLAPVGGRTRQPPGGGGEAGPREPGADGSGDHRLRAGCGLAEHPRRSGSLLLAHPLPPDRHVEPHFVPDPALPDRGLRRGAVAGRGQRDGGGRARLSPGDGIGLRRMLARAPAAGGMARPAAGGLLQRRERPGLRAHALPAAARAALDRRGLARRGGPPRPPRATAPAGGLGRCRALRPSLVFCWAAARSPGRRRPRTGPTSSGWSGTPCARIT